MHHHSNTSFLPSIITPVHTHKQLTYVFFNNNLNLTTSTKPEHIPHKTYNKKLMKHYYTTKLRSQLYYVNTSIKES